MRKALVFVLVAIGIVGAIGHFAAQSDPTVAARVKCEFAIEELTPLRVPVGDIIRATATGDEFNGTVQMPFSAGRTPYVAECVFVDGRFHRVTLNGEIIAGR